LILFCPKYFTLSFYNERQRSPTIIEIEPARERTERERERELRENKRERDQES